MDLYEQIGFKGNPFSRFSAEEELEYIDEIFNPPVYYSTIYTDIKEGGTRFIFGERGIGKSTLIFKLKNQLEQEKVFTVLIDKYNGISIQNNKQDIIIEVLIQVITKFSIWLLKNKKAIKKLDNVQKDKLSLFISVFFKSLSNKEFNVAYDKVASEQSRNFFKDIINSFLVKPANIFLSGTSEIVSDTIRTSLGLPEKINSNFYKSYIPEFKKNMPSLKRIEPKTIKSDKLMNILEDTIEIIEKCGYNKVVVFFDKIDEYPPLAGSISKVTKFISPVLLDTSLLQISNISFVFALWNRVRFTLNKEGVRFDKIKPIDVTWSDGELRNILQRRLDFFSEGKVSMDMILEKEDQEEILRLANKSPRQVLMLLSRIYDEQSKNSTNVVKFQSSIVEEGAMRYIYNFDFCSLYPGDIESIDYVINMIDILLMIGKQEFKLRDIKQKLNVSSRDAEQCVRKMIDYGLIKEHQGCKANKYEVVEPKTKYLIDRRVNSLTKGISELCG